MSGLGKIFGLGAAGAAGLLGAEALGAPPEAEAAKIGPVQQLTGQVASALDTKAWKYSSTDDLLRGTMLDGKRITKVLKQVEGKTAKYDPERRMLVMMDPESGDTFYRSIDKDYVHTMASKTGADEYVPTDFQARSAPDKYYSQVMKSIQTKKEDFGGFNVSDTLEEARNARRAYMKKQLDLYGEAEHHIETLKIESKGGQTQYVNVPDTYAWILRQVKKDKMDSLLDALVKYDDKMALLKENKRSTKEVKALYNKLAREYMDLKSIKFMSGETTGFNPSPVSLRKNPMYKRDVTPDEWDWVERYDESPRDVFGGGFRDFVKKMMGEKRHGK